MSKSSFVLSNYKCKYTTLFGYFQKILHFFSHCCNFFFSDTASFSLLAVSITKQFPFYYNSAKIFFAFQFFNELCRILPSDAVITLFSMFYYSTLKIFSPNNKKGLIFTSSQWEYMLGVIVFLSYA